LKNSPRLSVPLGWFRFSLRTLIVLITVLGIGLRWVGREVIRLRNQRHAIARVKSLGGDILFDYQMVDGHRAKPPSPAIVRWLLGEDAFAEVAYVQLWDFNTRLTDDDLQILHSFPALKSVLVHGAGISDVGAEHLARISKLEGLSLGSTSVTADGIKQLAMSTRLKGISIIGPNTNDATIAALGTMQELTSISLLDADISSQGLEPLTRLPKLRMLRLLRCGWLDDEAARHLAQLRGLEALDLTGAPIGDRGLAHLRAMPNLTSLSLSGTNVSDDGMEAVASLRKLRFLQLDGSCVGDMGVSRLRELSQLEVLGLFETGISDVAADDLASLTNLRRLRLTRTSVTDSGLIKLKSLAKLELLDVGPSVTQEGAQILKESLPNCRIEVWGTIQQFVLP
jgi:hypothetical protein